MVQVKPTTSETDSASGLDLELQPRQALDAAAIAVAAAFGDRRPFPKASRSTPTPPTGRRPAATRQANFGTELPAECPDSSKIGTFSIGTPALDGPLLGSVYIGDPKPGDQYRLILAADGFGVHVKLVGSIKPDPATGQLTTELVRPAPGPVRKLQPPPLRL